MEAHAFEAVKNNVFGTLEVASAAAAHGVETFVMISTDKAVRPANIMGASKRIAEMAVHAFGCRGHEVRFGALRQRPRQQWQRGAHLQGADRGGGPVRVTHPGMRRYFMTIPEAAQLVLQASTMGSGGEIFVLDMGEPVKIVDLASNLIRFRVSSRTRTSESRSPVCGRARSCSRS